MSAQALSPDTDRRFVETVIARGLVDADSVARAAADYERSVADGRSVGSLAQHLCMKGVLDRGVAAGILKTLRAESGSESGFRDAAWLEGEEAAGARSEPAEPPRELIGEYVLERELGRGGMGVVWFGRHRVSGATRAIKILGGAADTETLARFKLEAEALARVGSDVVVPVHEIGVARGRIYFSMGVMSGGSLRARLAQVGRYPWREAVALAATLARTLERCHAVGLVHRDLKPDNVLLDTAGRPRLADFGVARDLTGKTLTETGTVLGTPMYMPPEQLAGERVDVRADIYSLGALLHELIAGERPFSGTSAYEVFMAKRTETRGPLPEGTPAPLVALLARMLAANPELRPGSAHEVAEELDGMLASGGEDRASSRIRAWLALLVVGSALLAVEVGVLVRRHLRATPPPPPSAPTLVPASGDDLAAADRELQKAASILDAKRGSIPEAVACVDRAFAACPHGALPVDGLRKVVAAVSLRIDRVVAGAPLTPGEHLEAPYQEALALRALGRKLGFPVAASGDLADLAAVYMTWRASRGSPDWTASMNAGLIALEGRPALAQGVAEFALSCSRDLGKATPAVARAAVERACAVAPEDVSPNCLACRVRFLGWVGDRDAMLSAALKALGSKHERAYAGTVARAIRLATLERPLDPAKVEELVRAGGETPELILLRSKEVPGHEADVVAAMAAGFIENEDERAAQLLVLGSAELRRPYLERLLERGETEKAVLALRASGIPSLEALAERLRAAATPEERAAVLDALGR